MDFTYQYLKKRLAFGVQPLFCEQGPELCDSISTDKTEFKRYILRNPVHQNLQNTPQFSEHTINTYRAKLAINGVNHAEGGWAKDINLYDIEATQRYRRKIEKEDGYIHCVMSLTDGMEHYVDQNNAIDMYQTYFTELSKQPDVEKFGCRTVNVFKDYNKPQRPVSSISWNPEGGHKFAVAYADLDIFRIPTSSIECCIWDIENCNEVDTIFTPPCAMLDLQYNPRDQHILIGGLVSGQVGMWDARSGGSAKTLCPPHVAHRDIVRNVRFINSKSGAEFFSGSVDGCCKWWDYRKLSDPIDEMIIDLVKTATDVQSMARALPISIIEYEPSIPTRFMVGTDNGLVISGNRKGKTPLEMLPNFFNAHLGSVWYIERNPAFLKYFCTVGDWTAKIFSEDCKESPILWSPPHRHKVTSAAWSPGRCSLLLLAQWNGVLSIWDFLRRQYEPVLSVQVCQEPILKLEINENATIVACGTKKGNVFVAELSNSLTQSERNDKNMLSAVFERESKRERILEARLREIRLKQRQAEEGTPPQSSTDLDPTFGDRDLHEATADFMQTVKKELSNM